MGEYDWVIGVTFSFASSVLSCLGLIFQKVAHNQNQELPDDKKYPIVLGIVCSPCWWASFIMMGLFPFPFDFFAYSFAAQSLVAPFAGMTLLLNQFFAPLILGEKLYRIDIYASVVVFIGCTLTTATGNHDSESYVLDDLLGFFSRPEFIAGAVMLILVMTFMLFSLSLTDPLKADPDEADEASKKSRALADDHTNVGGAAAVSPTAGSFKSESASPGLGVGEGESGSESESAAEVVARSFVDDIVQDAVRDEQDVNVNVNVAAQSGADADAGSTTNGNMSAGKEASLQLSKSQGQSSRSSSSSSSSSDSDSDSSGLKETSQSRAKRALGLGEQEDMSCKSWLVYANFALRPFYYGFVAGGFGALQNIFFKSIGVLMKTSVFDDGDTTAWETWYPYAFIVATLVLAVLQLSFLNKGMARYDAILVFPLYNSSYIALSVLMGGLYYGEFNTFTQTQWVLFPLGVIVAMIGIIMFVFKPRDNGSEAGKTAKPDDDGSDTSSATAPDVQVMENVDLDTQQSLPATTSVVVV